MKEIPFSTILSALQNPDHPFPERYVDRFSDITPADLSAFLEIWPRVSPTRQHTLLKYFNQHYIDDTLLSFDELASQLIEDKDGMVRSLALQLLRESTDIRLLPRLLHIISTDPDPASRAGAATALGQFVHMGELEEIPAEKYQAISDALLVAAAEPDSQVARAALESLGYCTRPEVEALIAAAFQRHDPHWQAAALLAAGRSTDPRWQEQILGALSSPDALVRLAAVEAVGELSLKPARKLLLNMLEDEDDSEVFESIIWTLSLIGGEDVRTYLETLLDETEDDDLAEYIEDALANLSFTEDLEGFDLMAYDADDEVEERKKRK